MRGHINPIWNIQEFINLDYEIAYFHNNYQIDEYVTVGHEKESLHILKYLEPNPMPKCVYNHIYPHFFHLKNLVSAVNLFKPAKYLPYHKDTYKKYKELFDVSVENICRVVVMLEDWSPGQIILIDTEAHSGWKSGDYFSWIGETKHSFYNMSLIDRYALQITGTL